MSKEEFLNYIIDFAVDTLWDDLKRREQLRALITSWCFIFGIDADTKECDDVLEVIYRKVLMEPVIDFDETVSARGFETSLKTKDTVCKIEERYNREVKNNYKLTVVPVNPDATVANRVDYYTEDMASLIREGRIKII